MKIQAYGLKVLQNNTSIHGVFHVQKQKLKGYFCARRRLFWKGQYIIHNCNHV